MLDLDAIEAHLRTRRAITLVRWPSDDAYEEARELALMDLAGDVPALVARVRALEAALAEIAALAEATAQALDLLRGDERHLAYWPVLARLRDLRRLAEGVMRSDADPAPEGGA